MAQTAQLRRIDVAENEAQRVFNLQRQAYLRHPYPSYEERRANLDALERILVDNTTAIAEAISADFGHRAFEESMMAESVGNLRSRVHAPISDLRWISAVRAPLVPPRR